MGTLTKMPIMARLSKDVNSSSKEEDLSSIVNLPSVKERDLKSGKDQKAVAHPLIGDPTTIVTKIEKQSSQQEGKLHNIDENKTGNNEITKVQKGEKKLCRAEQIVEERNKKL